MTQLVHRVDVGSGHVLHVAEHGDPSGSPVLWIHGGPGSGSSDSARDLIDPRRHRLVLIDQRAAGRSTPHATEPDVDWDSIDMDHHVADIEQVRGQLGIDRWTVAGASWGSVLAATYAERHPDRVDALVLAAVSTGTRADIEWITVHSGRFFPAEWEAFSGHVRNRPSDERIVQAYRRLLFDPDPAVHEPAARAWCRWEDAHVAVAADAQPNPRYADPRFRLAFARQVTHCWAADSWLGEDEIVRRADALAATPGRLVHGRLDVSSPLDSAWRIHRAWDRSRLVVVEAGHGGEAMWNEVRTALAELVPSPDPSRATDSRSR